MCDAYKIRLYKLCKKYVMSYMWKEHVKNVLYHTFGKNIEMQNC